jgi:hypothetical protein
MDRKWWTLIAVSIGIFMLLLDITVVNVALPDIQRSLHSSFRDLQWVVNAYSLTLAAFLLTAGALADLLGRRRVFVAGLVVFTISSAVCGLSGSPLALNLARAVQGIGGAMMFATSLALIASAFQGKDRGVAFGVFGGVIGAAVAVGPVVGGVITSGIGWEWIFFVNVPIGIGAVFLTLTQVSESRDPEASGVDWMGFLTFSGSLFLLVFALIQGNEKGWGSTRILSYLIGSAILIVLFVVVERRQRRPMLDLTLFRRPAFAREHRGVHDLGVDVRDVPVPDPLRPGRARIRPAAGRPAISPDHAAVVLRGAVLRQAERARAGAAAARCRHAARGSGAVRDDRHRPQHRVDNADPGVPARRRRDRHGQPAPGVDRDRRGSLHAQRDGVRDQQHVSPGGDRDRHRRTRRHLSARCHSQHDLGAGGQPCGT